MKKLLTAVASLCAFNAFADMNVELNVVANVEQQTSITRIGENAIDLFGANTARFSITNNGDPVKVVVENAEEGQPLQVKSGENNFIRYTAKVGEVDIAAAGGHPVCQENNEDEVVIAFVPNIEQGQCKAGHYEGTALVKLVAVEAEYPDDGQGMDHMA